MSQVIEGYGKLLPELWTCIFRLSMPQFQDWRTPHPVLHDRWGLPPVQLLFKEARVLAAVCSTWRHLVMGDDQLKFVIGTVPQIRDYIFKGSPSGRRTGTHVWARIDDTRTSKSVPLREISEHLDALSCSTIGNNHVITVFQELADFCLERLNFLRVHTKDYPTIDLPFRPLNLPALTVLLLINIRILTIESPSSSIAQFADFVNALPHLERLELLNFSSNLVNIRQYTEQSIPHMEPRRLISLKSINLQERSYIVTFLLYHIIIPNLEYLEIHLTDGGEPDRPTSDSWYRLKSDSDFSKLLQLTLSTLDCNIARLLTSCSFPQLSRLLIEGTTEYWHLSDASLYMEPPWPNNSLKVDAPKLEHLRICESTPTQAWLLEQLCPEHGMEFNCITSVMLNVHPHDMLEMISTLDNVPPGVVSNVRSLALFIRGPDAAKGFDGQPFDIVSRLFNNVEDLQVYLNFTVHKDLTGFKFPTPSWMRLREKGDQLSYPA